jgi:hypothetical protein
MTTITRDDTIHDVEYVTKHEALLEIDAANHRGMIAAATLRNDDAAATAGCAAATGYAPPRRKISPLAAMLLMGSMLGNLPPPKPKRKCLLKGCDVMTDHNGGYCCAAHFAADCGHTMS